MVKFLLITACVIFQLFGFVLPVNADLPPGTMPLSFRPYYKEQVEYIVKNSCNPVGIVPYNGLTYYSCPSGESFWSQVLSPIPDSSLISYLAQEKRKNDENY